MAVQSIEHIFTSFRTIAQYLAEIGIKKTSRRIIYLHKIIVLRLGLALVAEQVVKRLPNDDCISIEPSHSNFVTITNNASPQKFTIIACLYLMAAVEHVGENSEITHKRETFMSCRWGRNCWCCPLPA